MEIKKNCRRIMYCVLTGMMLLDGCGRVINENTNNTIIEDIAKGELIIRNESNIITCSCDIDEDGNSDYITLDYSALIQDNQMPAIVLIRNASGKELYSDIIGIPHAGWRQYYVTSINHKPYVIRYMPPEESQGTWYYSMIVFSFDLRGEMVIYDSNEGNEKENISAFKEHASEYLDDAILLGSTWNFTFKCFSQKDVSF